MTFDAASVVGSDNKLSVWVTTSTVDKFTKIADLELSDKMETKVVDLSAFKGQPRVCVEIYCESNAKGASIVFDNINVYDQLNNDLGIAQVKAPIGINYDGTAHITASVVNFGKFTVDDFNVNLYKDGKSLLQSVKGTPIQPGKKIDIEFEYNASIEDPSEVRLHVEIDFAEDENVDNDASDPILITIVKPEAPAVDNLRLSDTQNGYRLEWSRPEYADGYPVREVEDGVERYIDFSISDIGRWTTYDVDAEYVYALGGFDNYPNMYGPAAYYVFNPTALGVTGESNISPNSGEKYFMAFSPQSGNKADDWLFSPELSGNAQTISFYAKGLQSDIKESFFVYYSKTEPTVENSTRLKLGSATGEWTKLSFDLPEGAKYFAIRYVSTGAALMLDDFTYEAAAMDSELTLLGYNVYCDGKKLNDKPIVDTSYTVPEGIGDSFYVTVQYIGVESAASNLVSVSGVGSIVTEPEYNGHSYDLLGRPVKEGERGNIIIRNGKKIIVTK